MRHGKDIIGKQIISITDGRLLGNVRDLYFNTDLYWLTGVYVGYEGLIKRKSLFIERDNVAVFGVDAILVKNSDVVVDSREHTEIEKWVSLDKLRGREIDTPGGTKVGTVGDIILSPEGHITGFVLSRVFIEGPIAKKGNIPRETLIDTGSEDKVMTVDLSKVERLYAGDQDEAENSP